MDLIQMASSATLGLFFGMLPRLPKLLWRLVREAA